MNTINNEADFRVVVDGVEYTKALRPRLVSLTLTDKRAGEADQLDLVLDDSDGRMPIPREGATLHVHLGWLRGSDVTPGLVDKGSFVIDDVEHSGPPDQITIRARSADFTSAVRTRKEGSWHGTTLGAIVAEVAKRNRLEPRCAPALASTPVTFAAQSRESDMAMLRRLGREHDAVATIKRGALILSPIGAGATPSGKAIPALALRRREGDRHSYTVQKRDEGGVTAIWHDRGEAKKKTVTAGKADGARKLARVYASEASAKKAADAAAKRTAREPRKLTLDLALGRADIYPERRVAVTGFRPEINAASWLVAEVKHSLTQQGFTTSLDLEAA